MPEEVLPIIIYPPVEGLDKYTSPHEMPTTKSPNMSNFICKPTYVMTRNGFIRKGLNLPICMSSKGDLVNYKDAKGVSHLIALTDRFAYEYQSSANMWLSISGASTSINQCDANTNWTAGSDITLTADGTIYHETDKSIKLVAGADIASDAVIATYTASVALTTHLYALSFWFYTTQDNLQLKINMYSGAAVAGPTFYQQLDSVVANTWYYVICYSDTPSVTPMTKLEVLVDRSMNSGSIVYIDDIKASEYLPFAGDRWAYCTAHDQALTNNGSSGLFITNESYDAADADIKVYEGHAGDYFKSFSKAVNASVELIEFWNHLCAANYVLDTTTYFKVRNLKFSDLADLSDFSAGSSSTRILTDLVGEIKRIIKLGYVAFVFASNSIGSLQYIGGNSVYSTPTETSELGLFACKAVSVIQNTCFFLGSNNTIQAVNASNMSSIGQLVEDFLFTDIDFASKENTVVFVNTANRRIYIVYPTSDGFVRKYISFDYRTNSCFESGVFGKDIVSSCMASITSSYYCDDPMFSNVYCDAIPETITSSIGSYFSDFLSTTGMENSMILDTGGRIYSMVESARIDDDSAIDNCFLETPDITREGGMYLDRYIRAILKFKTESSTARVNIYYTFDDYIDDVTPTSTVWTAFNDSPITIDNSWNTYVLPLDIRARRIRIKIVCSGTDRVYYLGGRIELVPGTTR